MLLGLIACEEDRNWDGHDDLLKGFSVDQAGDFPEKQKEVATG